MFTTLTLLFALHGQQTALPATAPADTRRDAVFGALTPQEVELDDAIPLPQAAVWQPGQLGDTLVASAHGDPYFLGFAESKYYPPAGERIDPHLTLLADSIPSDGRPARETYAFVMFSKRMTLERFATLQRLGARVLEFHPFYCVKVALTPQSIAPIAALDFVHWVGAEREAQKLDPALQSALANLAPGERLPVFINVFESDLCASSTSLPVGLVQESDGDNALPGNAAGLPRTWISNGWQQQRLAQYGVSVSEYLDPVHAFRATLEPAMLEALLALDFVQQIEPDTEGSMYHDESMSMINADRTRVSYDGGTNSAAVMAVLDTGCYLAHAALDPSTVGWDFTAEGAGPFTDGCGHGSHVCGTLLGNGDVEDSYRGVAPGLGWGATGRFYFGKMGQSDCSLSYTFGGITSAMHTPYTDGGGNTTPIPMGISCSWGNNTTAAFGTDTQARTWDTEIFTYDQQYIFAMGNAGPTPGVMGQQPGAKNVLAVGSVRDWQNVAEDPGELASDSSRGPTADGRWKPNVCAPGSSIRSVQAGTVSGYTNKSGTSMATPHVAGVAAQLCDHYSFLRYNPACLSAVLMAGAITKDNQVISTPSVSAGHLDTFGTGRVDAYKAQWGDSQQALYFWSTTLGSSSSTSVDFPINAGATRVTIVTHYKEAAASSGASQALVNDLDTYIDVSPFSAGNNTGDYTAQQSNLDNTEVRILLNPTATTWRIKIYPSSTVPFTTTNVGICAIVTYGDTTPTPTFNVSANDYYVQPGDDVTLNAYYYNPSYIASAVFLDSTSSGDALQSTTGTLIDGATCDFTGNIEYGRALELGNVLHGTSRSAQWTTHWNTEGLKSFSVEARSDNAVDVSDSLNIYVDGTQPGVVTNLHSTSHTINVWSNDDTIDFDWNAATDNLSGIDGYGVNWGGSANIPPANAKDIEQSPTSYTTPAFGDSASWYFSVRSLDNSGNWDADYVAVGPYKIDTTPPGMPTNVTSPTHTLGVQSCSTNLTVDWTAATDNLSGLAGYVWVVTTGIGNIPIGAPTIAANETSFSTDIGSSTLARYFHLRAVDNAGNYGTTLHFGPIYANANSVSTYCTAKTNSLGCLPSIGSNGVQPSKSAGNFTVLCTNVISQKNGLCFWGHSSLATPFQGGTLCVGAPTVRTLNVSSGGSAGGNDCSGVYTFVFDTAYMTANSIDPGDTIFAQFWMRDPAVASTTGLSNAIRFTVCQ
jgi:hypothetical protein